MNPIPPPQGMNPPGMPGPNGMPQAGMMPPSSTTNEELIEAIIDEKWNELVKDISKILDWKSVTEAKIARMDQQFADLKNDFDKLHQGVISRVGEYDKHILDVGAEIQSMEKVFAKVLPVFTETVSELGRITNDLRSARPNKTKE